MNIEIRCGDHILIRHKRWLDTAIRTYLGITVGTKRIMVEGFVVNLAFNKSFNMGMTTMNLYGGKLFIDMDKLCDWQVCDDPQLKSEPMFGSMSKCYRNASWVELKDLITVFD